MRQDPAALPVARDHQVHPASGHRDTGDLQCPDRVRPDDGQPSEQLREHRVRRVLPARFGLAVQPTDAHAAHQLEPDLADWVSLVLQRTTAQAQQIGPASDRQSKLAIRHRVALSKPALQSVFSKESFSSAGCPILACPAFSPTGAVSGATEAPNTPAARAISCYRHAVTWLGCMSCLCATSAIVLPSPRTSIATLALNTGSGSGRIFCLSSVLLSSRARTSTGGAADPLADVFRYVRPALRRDSTVHRSETGRIARSFRAIGSWFGWQPARRRFACRKVR